MLKVTVTQSPTLFAKLNAKTKRQIDAAKAAAQASSLRTFNRVQERVPRLTHYMAEHTQLRFTDEGLGYLIGWYRRDFIGQKNPVTGKAITTFYPRWVIFGARGKAGNDVLNPAFRAERGNFRKALQRAMRA